MLAEPRVGCPGHRSANGDALAIFYRPNENAMPSVSIGLNAVTALAGLV